MKNWCIERLTKVYSTRKEDFIRAVHGNKFHYQPGIIGIPSHHLGRYREFEQCLTSLVLPRGSRVDWGLGQNTAHNMNQFIRSVIDKDFEWLWIIGDDHVFPPDIVYQLLKRNKDVVVPFCCRRTYPYIPVVHDSFGEDGKWLSVEYDWYKDKSGLVNLNDDSKLVGNAGMLIKKKVLESIPDPWFEVGKIHPEFNTPDLWFAKKVAEKFNLWLDMDHTIGHLSHMAVWPYQDDDGSWKAEMRYPDDSWGERGLFVD